MDDLVVVGGASRMPWLRSNLRKLFPASTAMHMTDEAINAVNICASWSTVVCTALVCEASHVNGGSRPAEVLLSKSSLGGLHLPT